MNSIFLNEIKWMGIAITALGLGVATSSIAFAQSGHFVQTQTCTDAGTTLVCTGKVAGLGGTTFQINVQANGTAVIECENPSGNVAPGQKTNVTLLGSSGPLSTPKSGSYRYTISTLTPTVPSTPTCPNDKWTASVVDVIFGDATLTLLEDNVISDQEIVTVK